MKRKRWVLAGAAAPVAVTAAGSVVVTSSAKQGTPAGQTYLGYVSLVGGEVEAGPPSSIYVRPPVMERRCSRSSRGPPTPRHRTR